MRALHFAIAVSLVSACAVDETEPDARNPATPAVSTTADVSAPSATGDDALPLRLDAAIIRAAVDPVKDRVLACPNDAHATGIVKIKLNVQPDGSVEATALPVPAPDQRSFAYVESTELRECAARVMATASFPRTRNGGSFTYPFAF